MKQNKLFGIFALMFLIIVSLNLISAMVVKSVDADKFYPGQSGSVTIKIENTLNTDAEDVSLFLNLENTQFTTDGSSEKGVDEILEDEDESFGFTLRADTNIKPGDYNIPYTLTYFTGGNGTMIQFVKTGTFGVHVSAKTELSYDVTEETNIVGSNGKISVTITNKGLGDIGFASVKIISSNGFQVISGNEIYIGTIRSDDTESASYNVFYQNTVATITAMITYKDADNNQQSEIITLPVKVYTKEEALQLGLIQQSYTLYYAVIIIILIVTYIIYKKFKKARKKNGLSGR